MNIKDFEYRFNLASTHTAKDIQEWCDILNSGKEQPLKTENIISLYDFISSFNNVYNNFKKDLLSLPEYYFGKKLSLVCYDETYKDNKHNESLMLYIDEPNKNLVDAEDTFLQVWVEDDKYETYVTNYISPIDKNFYYNAVNIDKEILRKYIDFFKKYNSFIDTWKRISTSFIFGNGTSVMFLETNGDIMEELKRITLLFGNYFLDNSEDFEISILFGEDITVDYDNSKIECLELEENNKSEIINHLLKNIYLHRKDLSTLYENKEEGIFNNGESIIGQKETNGLQRKLVPNDQK